MTDPKRIAVIGAGAMARVRTQALLATGDAVVCGVAARTMASARGFGAEVGCDECFDDFTAMAATKPDAVLVEVPHGVQDEIVLWSLDEGYHTFVGGCLATCTASAERIRALAAQKRLVVEAGFEARYERTWEAAKGLVDDGTLGTIAAGRCIALWAGDPGSWYYNQQTSGGMPLTHMTYCFVNPLRWILGDPRSVSAFANQVSQTGPGMVTEETCVANLLFDSGAVCSMTASFIKPGKVPGWSLLLLGTKGAVEIFPEARTLTLHRQDGAEAMDFSEERDAFEVQAEAFLTATGAGGLCRNSPEETIGDVRVAEAIVASCREGVTVRL